MCFFGRSVLLVDPSQARVEGRKQVLDVSRTNSFQMDIEIEEEGVKDINQRSVGGKGGGGFYYSTNLFAAKMGMRKARDNSKKKVKKTADTK